MSENDHTIQPPQTLTFEPLGYLANDQSMSTSDESRPLETYANELTTNIIKDASQTVSQNHNENMDNTDELNVHQTSKRRTSETIPTNLDQSEYPITNGHHNGNYFDNDDIQKKMNGVIQDIQSGSPARKSIASNHLNGDQPITSTHVNSTEEPVRSSPLPIRQDESSSDIDDILGIKAAPDNKTTTLDEFIEQPSSEQENHTNHHRLENNDEFFNTKVGTMDDYQQSTNDIKPNKLDETSHFDPAASSRTPSVTSKQSVRATPDEPSTSGDDKRTDLSPSKLPDDAGNDTDLDNLEVAKIARRPSRAMSPLNRPRSPTPNDSRKMSTNLELSPSLPGENSNLQTNLTNDDHETSRSPIPSHDNQENQSVMPSSRRESTNNHDQQQTSRPTSATKVKSDENVAEPSTVRVSSSRTHQFSVPGEQLHIPTNGLDNERINSPPPLSAGIKSMVLVNPLLESNLVQTEQDQSQPPSETNRKSPTISTISNEKVIDGDILPSKSRRESNLSQQPTNNADQKPSSRRNSQNIEQTPPISTDHRASHSQEQPDNESHGHQHVASRRTSDVPQQPASRRESSHNKPQTPSPRDSTTTEQKPASRRVSNTSEQHGPSKRASFVPEHQTHSRQGSTASEQKITSRKGSVVAEHDHPSKPGSQRESIHEEPKIPSRKASTASEQQISNKRESPVPEEQSSSRRGSTHDEPKVASRRDSANSQQKPASRKASTTSEQHVPSKRPSAVSYEQPSNRRESAANDEKAMSRKGSTAIERQNSNQQENIHDEEIVASRKSSNAAEQHIPSRKSSNAAEQHIPSRKSSNAAEQHIPSRKSSNAAEQHIPSRKSTNAAEQHIPSRKSSNAAEQHVSSRKGSSTTEEQISNRRESHVSDKHSAHHRQNSFDENDQKPPSKAASRKASLVEQQQNDSRRESQHQPSSSRRTSTNRDNQPISPRRSSNVHVPASQESSRRNSINKQEPIPILAKNDDRRSSLTVQESTNDKRLKSSSTTDENSHRRSSVQRKPERGSKQQPSNLVTDETVVTPIIMDSSKARHQNGKHASTTDSSYQQAQTSKLPVVSSSLQYGKPRHMETKPLSSSHVATTSEDEQSPHWTKKIMVPSIHLSDGENSSSRENQSRPQSPNVTQIAERNPLPTPPSKTTSIGKKRDGPKRKEQYRPSHRSASADSIPNIRLVDDHSLDSTSEHTPNVERHKRRHLKPKKKDVETNTDQTYDLQRSLFDDKELTPKIPLKATKPMSDHLLSTRRRSSNKEHLLTTPDTMPDTDRSSGRHTIRKTKDSHQDKDPVHVNVTVVVKKFAGTKKDGTPVATAEAVVEQKPQQYFEPVQHPPESLSAPTEPKDESTERPKSIAQEPRLPSSEEKLLEPFDRHTQSDTEQIITDNQKKRRRPKRISRTCQTYESVFRRMEREEQHELRATSDTEKNIQTKKSQLRPRKKSPKKNLPVYLSTDSFRLEEVLPKQYHQSRRNLSKSSTIGRSLSPQGGKLLILRPTLPFHHSDAVNVQRVCLQYAIDLIPNENFTSAALATNRNNKPNSLKQPEQPNNLPMIGAPLTSMNPTMGKSSSKDKASSNRSDDYIHPRRNGGAV